MTYRVFLFLSVLSFIGCSEKSQQSIESQESDRLTDVILVNVDTFSRKEIAAGLIVLDSLKPSILAVNLHFRPPFNKEFVAAINSVETELLFVWNLNSNRDSIVEQPPSDLEVIYAPNCSYFNPYLDSGIFMYRNVYGSYEFCFSSIIINHIFPKYPEIVGESLLFEDIWFKDENLSFKKYHLADILEENHAENFDQSIVIFGYLSPQEEDSLLVKTYNGHKSMDATELTGHIVEGILRLKNTLESKPDQVEGPR